MRKLIGLYIIGTFLSCNGSSSFVEEGEKSATTSHASKLVGQSSCMYDILSYLSAKKVCSLQIINKKFYNKITPQHLNHRDDFEGEIYFDRKYNIPHGKEYSQQDFFDDVKKYSQQAQYENSRHIMPLFFVDQIDYLGYLRKKAIRSSDYEIFLITNSYPMKNCSFVYKKKWREKNQDNISFDYIEHVRVITSCFKGQK